MIHSVFTITKSSGLIRAPIGLISRKFHNDAIKYQWQKPHIGCIKLNFDGASKGNSRRASIGGVYRDHEGEFLFAYAEPIGKATSIIAELVAAKRGLELALENDLSNVWMEGDSMTIVNFFSHRKQFKSEEVSDHVRDMRAMIYELNDFRITHIYREGNKVADKFAKMGYELKKPQIWRHCPDKIVQFVREDAEGKMFLRRK